MMDDLLSAVLENAPVVLAMMYLFVRVDSRAQQLTESVISMAEKISAQNERILQDCIAHSEKSDGK